MKSDCAKKVVSESRKIRKPLMEKKRRARINDSLETLKQILLDSKTGLKDSSDKKTGQRTAKLEKADILEMTVRYVEHLRKRLHQVTTTPTASIKDDIAIRPADSSSDNLRMGVTLIPTKLSSGEVVFVMPSSLRAVRPKEEYAVSDNVWRPW